MGRCVEKIGHSCGTTSGLQVFVDDDGKYNGFCFSCGKFVPNPYEDRPEGYVPDVKVKTEEEIKAELDEIRTLPCDAVPLRMIEKHTMQHFGARVGYSEVDGKTPQLLAFPYRVGKRVSGAKIATLAKPKSVWSLGTMKGVDPFGWTQALLSGSKRLYITEGEIDAMSLWQVLMENNRGEYADTKHAVVSIPHGAASAARDLARIKDDIHRHFKEIVIVFDNDKPGKSAAEEVCKIFPDAVVAELPLKDANECLMEGFKKALFSAVRFNAAKPKNTRLVDGESLHESAKEPAQWGVSWPWGGVTDVTRGIRKGETIYIGAAQKMGQPPV